MTWSAKFFTLRLTRLTRLTRLMRRKPSGRATRVAAVVNRSMKMKAFFAPINKLGAVLAQALRIRFYGGRGRSPQEKYQWFWFHSSMH